MNAEEELHYDNLNMFKAAVLLLAERRRQVKSYLKDNPNDYAYNEEYKELCYKIDRLKHQYIHWRNKQNVTHEIENTFMNSSANYK